MKKVLIVVLIMSLLLMATGTAFAAKPNPTVPLQIKNRSGQAVEVALFPIVEGEPGELPVFFFQVPAKSPMGQTVALYHVPKGEYFMATLFCGVQSLPEPLGLLSRLTITIPECGSQPPVQNDGALKKLLEME